MIEVMTAAGILAVALLALISILSFSLRSQAKGGKRHAASLIGTTVLNQAGHDLEVDFSQSVARPRQVYAPNPDFQVAVAQQAEKPDLKQVVVSVYWTDQQGPQIETLATKYVRER
jgi:hypothetical protein